MEWTMYLSSFDGAFARIHNVSPSESTTDAHPITMYRPLKKFAASYVRKLDLADDHFRYVGTVDWHQAHVSFFRTHIKSIVSVSRRSIIPSVFRMSRSYTVKDDLWLARATFLNSHHQTATLQINHESFRLVRSDSSSQHFILYRIPTPFTGFYRTTCVDNNVMVGRVIVQLAQPGSNFHITLHQSVPAFLPVLLSFLLNSFVTNQTSSPTPYPTVPVIPTFHTFNQTPLPIMSLHA